MKALWVSQETGEMIASHLFVFDEKHWVIQSGYGFVNAGHWDFWAYVERNYYY
jgi:hypothetical protein